MRASAIIGSISIRGSIPCDNFRNRSRTIRLSSRGQSCGVCERRLLGNSLGISTRFSNFQTEGGFPGKWWSNVLNQRRWKQGRALVEAMKLQLEKNNSQSFPRDATIWLCRTRAVRRAHGFSEAPPRDHLPLSEGAARPERRDSSPLGASKAWDLAVKT
jgi:hypothetical protein